MIIDILFGIFLGVFLGMITGLIPGFHVNSLSAILFSFLPLLSEHFNLVFVAVLIVSMTISHVFFDFIPSIFLGAPSEESINSILPGHFLLLRGKGLLAFHLSILGCLVGLFFVILLSPFLLYIIPILFNLAQPFIGFILIFVALFVILQESNLRSKLFAFSVFIISGLLGVVVFSLNLRDPLVPLLSGLFGVSALFFSVFSKIMVPSQSEYYDFNLDIKLAFGVSLAGIFSGCLISLFPGVGPAQSAIISRKFLTDLSGEFYLFLVGLIASVSSVFSILTLFAIGKARNGSIVILSQFFQTSLFFLVIFLLVCLVSGGVAAILSLNFARIFALRLNYFNYLYLSILILIILHIIVIFISGFLGLFVLFISSCLGVFVILSGCGRHNAMGAIILPVIFYYF